MPASVKRELKHLLLADIIGHHAARRAFRGELREIIVGRILVDVVLLKDVDELRERRRDPHALLVLDALVALLQRLLDDEGEVFLLLLVLRLAEVHEHRDERGLAVGGQQRHDLILDGLHAAADLLAQALFGDFRNFLLTGHEADVRHLGEHRLADLLAADVDERREVGERDALPAVLVAGDLRDDLGRDVAGGGEGVRFLDQRAGDDRAVLEHVLQIDQVAVVHMLGIVVGIVEVDDAVLMRLDDVRGQQQARRQIAGDLARHIVALGGVDDGVLVRVLLLRLLVVALDQRQDLIVRGVRLAHKRAAVAVGDIALGDLVGAVRHDVRLDEVLDLLHGGRAVELLALVLHALGNALDLHRRHALGFVDDVVCLGHSGDDFDDIELDFRAVALDDLHDCFPFISK